MFLPRLGGKIYLQVFGFARLFGALGFASLRTMEGTQLGFDLGEQAHDPEKPLFDPDDIRVDCLALIAEARANCVKLVWDADTLKYNRILFPHVASWIPDEAERAQLCFEFAEECRKIALLLAA